MKTDYNNINKFEVAIVSMIAVGFVILGVTLFTSLTPRQQANVTAAFKMFDVREQAAATVEDVKFIFGVPEEFYNQFYIAFTEVVSFPAEDIELATSVAVELKNNVVAVFDNLTSQVVQGYAQQNQLQERSDDFALLPYDGKIMGAMIDLSDKISSITVREKNPPTSLNLHYEYSAPKIELLNSALKYLN
jgi:hypothetical protein